MKKIISPAKEELENVGAAVKKQVVGDKDEDKDKPDGDSLTFIEQVVGPSGAVSDPVGNDQKKTAQRQHIKRQEEFEEDQKKAAEKKKQLEDELRQIRDPEPKDEQVLSQPGEPLMPASKPSRGAPPGAKRKQTQVEARLGKN